MDRVVWCHVIFCRYKLQHRSHFKMPHHANHFGNATWSTRFPRKILEKKNPDKSITKSNRSIKPAPPPHAHPPQTAAPRCPRPASHAKFRGERDPRAGGHETGRRDARGRETRAAERKYPSRVVGSAPAIAGGEGGRGDRAARGSVRRAKPSERQALQIWGPGLGLARFL